MAVPTFDTLMNPILKALHDLGGSGTIEEINNRAIEIAKITDKQLEVLHNPEKSSQTEIEYRLAWARSYLKKYELLENSSRGVWSLTAQGRMTKSIEPQEVKKYVREMYQRYQSGLINENTHEVSEEIADEIIPELSWREELLQALLKMDSGAFERLTQRLLREAGFTQVEVTGRSGDGGIDGKGIMRLGGLLSFHVLFQCKRYRDTVSAGHIRDFRGALEGRADKGIFITTGRFTQDAEKEATRDGAKPIDLVDGNRLVDLLKQLGLGVKTEMVEKITINSEWFINI